MVAVLWQAYFLVVYDRESGQVVGFYDNKNEALLGLYLQHTPYFHAACMTQPWARYLTPCPASLHLPDPQTPQPWSQSQVFAPAPLGQAIKIWQETLYLFGKKLSSMPKKCPKRPWSARSSLGQPPECPVNPKFYAHSLLLKIPPGMANLNPSLSIVTVELCCWDDKVMCPAG